MIDMYRLQKCKTAIKSEIRGTTACFYGVRNERNKNAAGNKNYYIERQEITAMTFTYPAVFTPHKDDNGYHVYFPDLECCEADGPDLEDAIDEAKDAAYNWLCLELEEGGEFPGQSHADDLDLPEGSFVKQLRIIIKLLPDSD